MYSRRDDKCRVWLKFCIDYRCSFHITFQNVVGDMQFTSYTPFSSKPSISLHVNTLPPIATHKDWGRVMKGTLLIGPAST